MATNNTANVSVTKGVQGGYFFSAPKGTTLPTDCDTALSSTYVNLGFISEDGITESISASTDVIPDLNGDSVGISTSDRTETLTLKLLEVKADTLKEIYGAENVTDANGLIKVKHSSGQHASRVYILELLLKDGRKWRQVIPDGEVTEVGDMVLGSGQLSGREITITCKPGDEGASVIDYIESTETTA